MGKKITLICDETPGLKLGPGVAPSQTAGELIVFGAGFAEFDADDFPDWEAWVNSPGAPHIEVVESDDKRVSTAAGIGVVCPTCGKAFAEQRALNGHRLSHRPR